LSQSAARGCDIFAFTFAGNFGGFRSFQREIKSRYFPNRDTRALSLAKAATARIVVSERDG
jgi:hypothetical protein